MSDKLKYREYLRQKRTKLYHEQRGLCFYCQEPMLLAKGPASARLPARLVTLDHIVPKSHGGAIAENTVAACFSCNNERGDTDARLFMLKKQGML